MIGGLLDGGEGLSQRPGLIGLQFLSHLSLDVGQRRRGDSLLEEARPAARDRILLAPLIDLFAGAVGVLGIAAIMPAEAIGDRFDEDGAAVGARRCVK